MDLFVYFATLLFLTIVAGIKLIFISLVVFFKFLIGTPYGWGCFFLFILFSCCKKDTK
ncbi:putative membrane protein [Escherichia coli BCE034_MS-14]|nr:putative membrane protein [Escherichia coli BCE034_MS-14]